MTLDINQAHHLATLTGSFNDEEALYAVKDLRALLEHCGVRLEDAVHFALTSQAFWDSLAHYAAPAPATETAAASSAGLPLCRWVHVNGAPGIETAPVSGVPKQWAVSGAAADALDVICERLKDALIVATINSCSLKIKLKDIEDERGNIVETLVQTEFSKDLAPIILWAANRGDAATLASTLRQAAAHAKP